MWTLGTTAALLIIFLFLSPAIVLLHLFVVYLRDAKGLRKYPTQNWGSGLTSLAYGWECGRLHKDIHSKRLHEALQENPVVRIGPNWLAFGRSQAVKDIYGYASRCRKAAIYDLLSQGGTHTTVISDKSLHAARRRMVASSYAPKHAETWECKVVGSMTALMEQIDKRCTGPEGRDLFDAVHWIFLFSVESAIKIMLSKDVFFLRTGADYIYFKDADGKDQAVRSIHSAHASQRATATVIWDVKGFPFWKRLTGWVSKTYADNWQSGGRFNNAMEALTKERMERHANGEQLDDLFQLMLEDRKGDEPAITTVDRIAEVGQVVGSATDGPAVSIIMTLYYLVRYPHTFVQLRAELDGVLSPEEKVASWARVKNLPYLRACIDEAMRLAPPVATELIRRTPPDTNTIIAGEVIPPDTNVSIAAYTAHRDPYVFPNPTTFNPSRWLAKGSEHLREMRAILIPFSTGTRGCIGRNVSIVMQAMCVATLVCHYDFALKEPDWEMEFEEWFNLWPMKLPLQIWRRDASFFPRKGSVGIQ